MSDNVDHNSMKYLLLQVITESIMGGEEASIPMVAVTAAVGAIVLLFFLVINVFRSDKQKDEDSETEDAKAGWLLYFINRK